MFSAKSLSNLPVIIVRSSLADAVLSNRGSRLPQIALRNGWNNGKQLDFDVIASVHHSGG